MKVQLVSGDTVVAEAQVAIALHDQSQLVVGVVSENPAQIVSELKLLPSQSGAAADGRRPSPPRTCPSGSRPGPRSTGSSGRTWTRRSSRPAQLAALRTWLAGGGRLVIVGGTAGADTPRAFPDDLLPYRPDGVLDVDPSRPAPDPRRRARQGRAP